MMRKSLFPALFALLCMGLCAGTCTNDNDDESSIITPGGGDDEPTTPTIKIPNGYSNGIGLYLYRTVVQIGGEKVVLKAKRFVKDREVEPWYWRQTDLDHSELTAVKWKSDDESIATVSTKGEIVPKKAGYVNIYAYTDDGKAARCRVKVEPKSQRYGVHVAGYELTEYNYKDVTKFDGVSGSIEYNPASNLLTLEDCTINMKDSVECLYVDCDDLTIFNKGKSKLSTNHCYALAVHRFIEYTIPGDYSSPLKERECTIQGRSTSSMLTCTSTANGDQDLSSGIALGEECELYIYNASVTAKGVNMGVGNALWHMNSGRDEWTKIGEELNSTVYGNGISGGALYLSGCDFTAICNTDSRGLGCVYALANISHDLTYEIEPGGSVFDHVLFYLGNDAPVWCVNKGGVPVKGTLRYVAPIN